MGDGINRRERREPSENGGGFIDLPEQSAPVDVGMTMYSQQIGTYPYNWVAELPSFVGTSWPEQNVQLAPDGKSYTYLGPRSGPFACLAYNRMHGAFMLAKRGRASLSLSA
jgi:hypothetical protein